MNEHGGPGAPLEPALAAEIGANDDDWDDPGEITKSLPVPELLKRHERMLAASALPLPTQPSLENPRPPPADGPSSARPSSARWARGKRDFRETSPLKKVVAFVVLVLVSGSLTHLVVERRRSEVAAGAAARPSKPQHEGAPSESAPSAALPGPALAEPDPARQGEPEASAAAPASLAPGAAATLQRSAVDALAAGDFKTALERYRELSAAEPGAPAYREACRILEERAARAAKEAR